MTKLEVISGCCLSRGAFVTILYAGKEICQISVDEANHFAGCLNQASEAAETDGFIVAYFSKILSDAPEDERIRKIGTVLVDFREHRENMRKGAST